MASNKNSFDVKNTVKKIRVAGGVVLTQTVQSGPTQHVARTAAKSEKKASY